jgi:hypothetical protein
VVTFFRKLYQESHDDASDGDRTGPQEDLLIFQKKLKLIPKWNQHTLETVIDLILGWIRNRHFQIIQSIKTVIVARTMLMVAMGNADAEVHDQVRVDIPDKYNFLHKVICMIASELYTYPSLLRRNARDTEIEQRSKQKSMNQLISEAIENTIIDQISSPAVFAYLHQAMNADRFNTSNDEDEDEDEDEGEGEGMTQKGDDEQEDEEEKEEDGDGFEVETKTSQLDDMGFEISDDAKPQATTTLVSVPAVATVNNADTDSDTFVSQ